MMARACHSPSISASNGVVLSRVAGTSPASATRHASPIRKPSPWDTVDGMPSPLTIRVRVDRQGRLVVPQQLRDGIVETPGELLLHRTPDGLLLSPVREQGVVRIAEDGLPVLDLDRPVTNAQVLTGIEEGRRHR